VTTTSGYDAFMSYSHEHDRTFAPALQTAVERFAKPWYRLRGRRVFRDTVDLAVNPSLWSVIEDGLTSSAWLVLLASAESARSEWVNKEVAWWLAYRSPARLLIVGTSPGLAWDDQASGWAPDAPVPPALRHLGQDGPPLWVDLSSVHDASQWRAIPADAAASLAAPLSGVSKEMLLSEQRQQHRRVIRLAAAACAVLLVAAVVATGAAFIAVAQRDNARIQAKIATAQELAALAVANLSTDLDASLLFAAAATHLDNNVQARAALYQAVTAAPHLVFYLQTGATVSALATAADGNVIAAGTAGGQLVRFDLAAGRRVEVATGLGSITAVAVSADGNTVVAADGARAVVWNVASGAGPVQVRGMSGASSVAVSPSGQLVAVLGSTTQVERNLSTGQQISTPLHGSVSSGAKVAFLSDSALVLTTEEGAFEELTAAGLRPTSSGDAAIGPSAYYTPGMSPNGAYSGFIKEGLVTAWTTTAPVITKAIVSGSGPAVSSSYLTISPDGNWAASVGNGTVYLIPLSRGQQSLPPSALTRLTASADTAAVAFLGSDDRLVTASGDTLAVWNLQSTAGVGQDTGIQVASSGEISVPPEVAFSPDERYLAITGGGTPAGQAAIYSYGPGGSLTSTDTTVNETAVANAGDGYVYDINTATRNSTPQMVHGVPAYDGETGTVSPDRSTAVIQTSGGGLLDVNLSTGTSRSLGSGPAGAWIFTPDLLLVQRRSGALEEWNLAATRLLKTVPGTGAYTSALAVSPDGTMVARLSESGTASVIDLASGQPFASFSLPTPSADLAADPWQATALIFTPDSQALLTVESGGDVIRWDIAEANLIKMACYRAGGNLTSAEWDEYVHTSPPADLSCLG
jgi:WD40 repeat protein